MMSVTSIFSIVLLPLMLVFPWIMKKIGGMSKMVGAFACIGIVGYIIVFVSGANLTGVLLGGVLGGLAGLPLAYYGVLFIMNCCTYNEMIGLPRMDGSAVFWQTSWASAAVLWAASSPASCSASAVTLPQRVRLISPQAH